MSGVRPSVSGLRLYAHRAYTIAEDRHARTANGIVSGILNLSQVFVAPFEGILKTNSLNASGSVLDIAAVVALIGWTVIELIVVSVLGLFGRETA